MHENIKRVLAPYGGEWKEKKGVREWSTVIAERKAFLSKKKLTYSARMRFDDGAREIRARVEAVAGANGYRFEYQVLPVK